MVCLNVERSAIEIARWRGLLTIGRSIVSGRRRARRCRFESRKEASAPLVAFFIRVTRPMALNANTNIARRVEVASLRAETVVHILISRLILLCLVTDPFLVSIAASWALFRIALAPLISFFLFHALR